MSASRSRADVGASLNDKRMDRWRTHSGVKKKVASMEAESLFIHCAYSDRGWQCLLNVRGRPAVVGVVSSVPTPPYFIKAVVPNLNILDTKYQNCVWIQRQPIG